MWIRTAQGIMFFEVKYTSQGLPYIGKKLKEKQIFKIL